ncbi:MAG: DUF1015 domain-containing protein [Acidobacteriota bacterium]
MAKLFPFRAYRYNPQAVGDVSDVVTQPYDKISEQMRKNYLERHPANIVRVIKNADHDEAAQYLNRWIEEGVLRQDASPAFYPYEQIFDFEGETFSRLGFIGLISLQDADIAVKGHEKILQEPLEDRLKLIRATISNEGLIFMLYSDIHMQVDDLLGSFREIRPPITEMVDDYGVKHRLWQLLDSNLQEQIAMSLQKIPLYIADGHHRFQTSHLYFRECLEKGWKTQAVESFDKRMVALFNMEAAGLRILPTHRGIRNLEDFRLKQLLSRLELCFEIEILEDPDNLETCMRSDGKRIGLTVKSPGRFYCLKLKSGALDDSEFMPEVGGPARELDVNLLHEGILRPFLGIGAQELSSQKYVDYFRSRDELLEQLRQGKYQAAFFLNPTTLEQVRQISELGEKMPQKSTDFYPKLLSGLVLMKMRIDKEAIEKVIKGYERL